MPVHRIGIQLRSLRLPFRKAVMTARELGADAIEIDLRNELRVQELGETASREIRKLLSDLGLKVAAAAFPTRRGFNTEEELEARVRHTKEAMLAAARIGAPVLVNHVGKAPADEQSPEFLLMVDVLSDLAAYGARVGSLLAATTGTESGADLARLLAKLPEGTLGVNLDPAGLESQGHSPLAAVSALGPNILHAYARDAVRNAGPGWGAETVLGRGTVDFPALLGALEEQNYRGYVTIARMQSDQPLEDVRNAVEYLRAL